ncbi:hypothetical protein DMN77_16645 [Paenibacillus sp. 79R4]|nr:hypothetical protein [Paenibacillus sp. 79R4]
MKSIPEEAYEAAYESGGKAPLPKRSISFNPIEPLGLSSKETELSQFLYAIWGIVLSYLHEGMVRRFRVYITCP